MEHLHTKKDSWLAWSLFVCLILALSLSTTACGKKKKSSGIANTPGAQDPLNPSCTDCGTYTDELAAGLNLGFFGYGINPNVQNTRFDLDASLVVYAPSSNSGNQGAYQGAVYVEGYMKVINTAYLNSCVLPEGEYDIMASQAGGQYSHSSAFELTGIQLKLKNRSTGEVFPHALVVDYLEFEQSSGQRNFDEGGQIYSYQLSFFGQTSLCNQSIFFPKGG